MTPTAGAAVALDQAKDLMRWQNGSLTRWPSRSATAPAYCAYADGADRLMDRTVGQRCGGLPERPAPLRFSTADGRRRRSPVNVVHEDRDAASSGSAGARA